MVGKCDSNPRNCSGMDLLCSFEKKFGYSVKTKFIRLQSVTPTVMKWCNRYVHCTLSRQPAICFKNSLLNGQGPVQLSEEEQEGGKMKGSII